MTQKLFPPPPVCAFRDTPTTCSDRDMEASTRPTASQFQCKSLDKTSARVLPVWQAWVRHELPPLPSLSSHYLLRTHGVDLMGKGAKGAIRRR